MKSSFEPTRAPRDKGFVAWSGAPRTPAERAVDARQAALAAGPSLEEQLQEAYQRGRSDELAAHPPLDATKLEGAASALAGAADRLGETTRDELGACSQAVVDLALLVAERIVRTTLPGDWEGLRARLDTAIASLAGAETPQIELNPDDLEACRNYQAGALDGLFARTDLHFEANPALRSGEVRVRRDGAEIDARVEAMLEPFRAELRALVAPGGGAS